MKKMILSLAAVLVCALSWAQTSKRMPLPELKFNDAKQQELFDRVAKSYNSDEVLGFEGEYLDMYWDGHQHDRMGAAFLQYLIRIKDSEGDMLSSKDVVTVGKALIDWYMGLVGQKVPASYPYNFKAYKACVDGFLKPVAEPMCDGAQLDMNQYAYADNDMNQFLGMLKQNMVAAKVKGAKLKAALDAETESWLEFRNALSSFFYEYRCKLNDGMGYSMLPLEVASQVTYADAVRDSSLNVLYAITSATPGAVYLLSEEDLSETLMYFSGEMKDEGMDAAFFEKVLDKFLEKRKDVRELLPENLKEIFQRDTLRYFRILLNFLSHEE